MTRTGRPLLWVAGLVFLGLVTLAVVRSFDSEVIEPPPPAPSTASGEDSRPAAAAALLADLETALNAGSRRDAVALAAPGEPSARRNLAWLQDNVRALGVEDLSLRYVDERAGSLTAQDRTTLGPDAWVADVELSWRPRASRGAVLSNEATLTLVDAADGAAFGSSTGDGETQAPLWLLAELDVDRAGRAVVAAADEGETGSYLRRARRAVSDVSAVLPRWDGRLVVEVPQSPEQLHRVLGADPGSYDSIAAITATVDGSTSDRSPTHVYVNPEVLGDLGPEGAQIVLSHEAAHVALDAATSDMPLWLLEGFADYVALARSDLPVEVTAGQVLAEVRRDGPPRALPGKGRFDPTHDRLGTSYEAAWLACRLLAEEYGERRLVAFYRSVDRGTSTDEAFARLGTTQREFTRQWREYLRELAG